MNRYLIMSALAIPLLFIGAGCGNGDIAIPAGSANGESALTSATGIADRFPTEAAAQAQQQQQETAPAGQSAQQPAPIMQTADAGDTGEQAMQPRPKAFPGVLPASRIHGKQVRITTPKGDIVFEVLDKEGPKAASNFVALAESGYYDGLIFHRVEPGFVIQGGDPTGTGRGGPGYQFEDEKVNLPYDAGIVAMANAGKDTNGSQFFIMLEDKPLDPLYTIFGRVTSGMEVVRSIKVGDRMTSVVVEAAK